MNLPEDFIVTYSTNDQFIKLEPMSLINITKLGIKVGTSFGGFLNCDDNGVLNKVGDIKKDSLKLK